jgi:hypothetical protein
MLLDGPPPTPTARFSKTPLGRLCEAISLELNEQVRSVDFLVIGAKQTSVDVVGGLLASSNTGSSIAKW